MEALEKYYQEYLLGYSQDANWSNYDVDMQMTKDRIEQILEVGYLSNDDVKFVYSLLPDIEDETIRMELEYYLKGLIIL